MDLPNNSAALPAGLEDRLSSLPDGVLGHILSFLPGKEAARAAVLCRRWRYAFASVHTLSFVQEPGSGSYVASMTEHEYRENVHADRNANFVALVDAAFSCRRRCSGAGREPGLRGFRVAFDSFHHSLARHVDRWLSVVMRHGTVAEIHVDARRQEQRACARELTKLYYDGLQYDSPPGEIYDESDGDDSGDFRTPKTRDRAYRAPRALYSFSAASLRTLCLGSCFLDLPPDANIRLPSVETLTLIWIPDSGRDIQRLVSGCPRLVDLTLDSCRRVRAVTVLDKRLRRLALRCCHGARLTVDASELRVLEYKGPVPHDSVLSFVGSPLMVVSCDIEFCGGVTSSESELVDLAQFLGRFAGARWLRLGSSSAAKTGSAPRSGIEMFNSGFPQLLCLRHLELKGTVMSESALDALAAILQQTPNLEILTLLILPDTDEYCWHEVCCDPNAVVDVPDVRPIIPCLQDRVREINVVHYQGRMPQRKLLKLLLHHALALYELYVVFPKGKYAVQTMLMGEIQSWVMNRPVKVMFA